MLSLIPSFHVLTGLPSPLFPCGFYSVTCLAILRSSFASCGPYQLNSLPIVSLLILSIRNILAERIKQSISVANNTSICLCFRFIDHVSVPYLNILLIVDFYIINFVESIIFLSDKTEFCMLLTLLVSQIFFSCFNVR
jgi:hypothetical protein